MSQSEIDAGDVLDKYGAVLEQGQSLIMDEAELPYTKPVIIAVLEHCIAVNNDEKLSEYLKAGYLNLAYFQPLSETECKAIDVFEGALKEGATAPTNLSSDEIRNLASDMSKVGDSYEALQNRIAEEMNALKEKLDSLSD
jgi:hypothetical protein